MIIRKAHLADAHYITKYLLLAMEDIIFEFIGQRDLEIARQFLLHFVQMEANQYSYTNCFVAEDNGQVIGAINIYNGANLNTLRKPIESYIKSHFSIDYNPEDETQKGEYYIDSLGVDPAKQGKGIGAKLLAHVIGIYVHQYKQPLGLLVDEENPQAQRLYLKTGFKLTGRKTLVGKRMLHLQIKSN